MLFLCQEGIMKLPVLWLLVTVLLLSASLSQAATAYTIKASAKKGGTITPSGKVVVSAGDSATFTMAPGQGYYLKDVVVDGASEGPVAIRTFTALDRNHAIAAIFAPDPVITVKAGKGGGVSPAGKISVPYGSDQGFAITPSVGYHILDVLADGVSLGTVSAHEFTGVVGKHSLSAKFALNEYPLEIITSGHGAVTPIKASLKHGTKNLKFSVVPEKSYRIADVKVNGISKGPVSRVVIDIVTGPLTVEAIFEPLASTAAISGVIKANGTGLGGVIVTLSGAASATATTSDGGSYGFPGLANGGYTVTPQKEGYTFSPASAPVTVNGASVVQDFTAGVIPPATHGISGLVTAGGTGLGGVTVTLTGAATATTTTAANGGYGFTGLGSGSYTVTPAKTGYVFAPASAAVEVVSTNVNQSFTATLQYAVSGIVATDLGVPVVGAQVAIGPAMTSTDAAGTYLLQFTPSGETALVTTSGTGLTPQISLLNLKNGVDTYSLAIRMSAPVEQSFTAAAGATVPLGAVGSDATVTIPPNGVTGPDPHIVRVVSYDPRFSPGTLQNGNDALQSAGMFHLDVRDATGVKASLAPGALVGFSLAPYTPQAIPDAEPFQGWRMNVQNGRWENPAAVGSPQNGMAMNADDYGYWNFDRNYKTACVKGKIATTTGACRGGRVRADGPDGICSFDNAGGAGDFCVTGAQTLGSNLVIGRTTQKVTMPASPGNCTNPDSCLDIGTVTVSNTDCEAKVADTCANTGGLPDDIYANSVIYASSKGTCSTGYPGYLTVFIHLDATGKLAKIDDISETASSISGSVTSDGTINVTASWTMEGGTTTIVGKATPMCIYADINGMSRTFSMTGTYTYVSQTESCSGTISPPQLAASKSRIRPAVQDQRVLRSVGAH
jgi:hypothetical protein